MRESGGGCLKDMGAFDRDVLEFAVERIMEKGHNRRKGKVIRRMREQLGWKRSRAKHSLSFLRNAGA